MKYEKLGKIPQNLLPENVFNQTLSLYTEELKRFFFEADFEHLNYAAWYLLSKRGGYVIEWLEQGKLQADDLLDLNLTQSQILADHPLMPDLIKQEIFTMDQIFKIGLCREWFNPYGNELSIKPRTESRWGAVLKALSSPESKYDAIRVKLFHTDVQDLEIIFRAFCEFSEKLSNIWKYLDSARVRHFLLDFLQDFFSGEKMAALNRKALEKFFPCFSIKKEEYQEPLKRYRSLFTNIPQPDLAKKILSQREFSRALLLYESTLKTLKKFDSEQPVLCDENVKQLNYTAWYLLSKRGDDVIKWLQQGKLWVSDFLDLNLTQSQILADHPLMPILIEKEIFTIDQIVKIGFYAEWFQTNSLPKTIIPDSNSFWGLLLTKASAEELTSLAEKLTSFNANAEKLDIIFRAFNGFVGGKVGSLRNLKSPEDVRKFLNAFWDDSFAPKSTGPTVSEKEFQDCFRSFFLEPAAKATTGLVSAPVSAPAPAPASFAIGNKCLWGSDISSSSLFHHEGKAPEPLPTRPYHCDIMN